MQRNICKICLNTQFTPRAEQLATVNNIGKMITFAQPEQRGFFWAASLLRVAAPSYRKIKQAIADEPRTNKARNDRASMQLITTAHTVRLVI